MFGQRNEFLTFFPNCTGSSLYVNPQVIKGGSDKTKVHSALWKFYLLIMPNINKSFAKDDDWIEILKAKRDEFFTLKETHFKPPPKAEDPSNPLSEAEDSEEWKQYYADKDLREQIRRDVVRAFQELDYFHQEETLQTLEDILFLFCKTHPSYGYPQGLHEIAAFVLYVLHEEMQSNSNDVISFIFSQNAVIPDTYFVFSAIAELIEPFYKPPDSNGFNYLADISERIQNKIISDRNPRLAEALQSFGIAPHAYMMKWLRLLFLSVFEFESLKTIWDVIFCYAPNLNIVANVCAAMLMNAQKKLLKCDSTEALQLLFHYPTVPNSSRFAYEASEMMPKPKTKNGNVDLVTAVSERLNELSHRLNEVCSLNGYELALPYVMDLCRTRDVLLGILPLEEMLPLEQAVELFKPQTVDHNVKELPPEAVITQNTKIVAPESSRPFEDAERKQRAKEAAAAAKKEAAKQAAAKKKAKKLQNTLFGEGNDDVESLFSADLKKPTTSPVKKPKPAQNSKSIKSPSTSTSTPASESTTKKITETPAIEPPRPAKPKSVGAMSLSASLEKPKKKLFDDNDDALDKRKPKQPPKKEKPKDSLFDDDDDIILKL